MPAGEASRRLRRRGRYSTVTGFTTCRFSVSPEISRIITIRKLTSFPCPTAFTTAPSLAAIGVAAHECGHAVQHATGYVPNEIRSAVFPIARLGSTLYFYVFLLGIIFSFEPLVDIGIIMFAFVVLFQLVTLPVEFNASRRAMLTLSSEGLLEQDELYGARRTLTAAAMTYVASLAVSVTQLLRMLASRNRR